MSVTSEVFPHPRAPMWYWIYYIITKPEEFQTAKKYASKPVVLMFSADWNEACKVMKKPFREKALANRTAAVFCLVDVDKLNKKDSSIVANYQVEALPTFVLLKDGQERERVVGAKMEEFSNMVKNI
uniref:Thioredoxin n=1 Tax=Saccharum hybrid cultivar Yacheng05-179 TaxID=1472232 RepID=W8SNK4_9POAL|nr:thioredoxin [Saccharum hybrid cultivar Yacheng05-179]